MPLAFQLAHEDLQLVVWKITENLDFFTERISYRSSAKMVGRIRQQMASRYLLEKLLPGFPFEKTMKLDSGKLIILDSSLEFSLSHNDEFAAAILSQEHHVGIDIEKIHDRILKVGVKFLNQLEWDWLHTLELNERIKYMTLCWCIKEAVFKCWSHGGIDFADHICISKIDRVDHGKASITFKKAGQQQIQVYFKLIEDHWLAYVKADLQ